MNEMWCKDDHFRQALVDLWPGMVGFWRKGMGCTLANRAFLNWFGKSWQSIEGMSIQDFLGPTLFHSDESLICAALTGQTTACERKHTLPSGEMRESAVQYIPYIDGTGVQGFFILILDTSDRFRMEQELVTTLEYFQRSIGHELHDNLGQQMAAIAYQAKALEKNLSLLGHPEAVAMASSIALQAQNAVLHCKQMAQGFFHFELETHGLEGALRGFATKISSTYEIKCDFVGSNAFQLDDPNTVLNLYRIVQEASHNAIRHGCATHLSISLIMAKDRLSLSVSDNGQGVADSKAESLVRSGMGIKIMQYRARQLGANLKFLSGATGGMQVLIEMALPHQAA